ncbi:MAG: ATP-binding protein [Bacteroidetes bacterium]|nr:MAG: ATP-binding protein [Bacteroidota bacterium]
MILQEQISFVMNNQGGDYENKSNITIRTSLSNIPMSDSFATIITGVRRCGKSTLLQQLLHNKFPKAIFFNFEDIRLTGFEAIDFMRFHNEIVKREIEVLFLDEIQLVSGWEVYVNQLLREGYKVFVTGSNASMLSKELGTNLTGRHLSVELFPFDYNEYLTLKQLPNSAESAKQYIFDGGFPEYLKTGNGMILTQLLNDIITRDIAVRYSVKNVNSLKALVLYLLSNVGKPVSANKLKGLFGIKSVATITEFFSYMQDAYLLQFLPQFSYSIKAQIRNPKKVYAIDTGMVNEISSSFSMDLGRKLENVVYLHLRRIYKELFFYKNKGECDFIIKEKGNITQAIQVCYKLTDLNLEREINGLLEALKEFNLKEGFIITMNQQDEYNIDSKKITVIPLNNYL